MSCVRLTVAQFSASLDVEENLKACYTLISEASGDSDLVVLPENAMYSDPTKERADSKYSEPLNGPFVSALQDAAREHAVAVLAGITETHPEDSRTYNTLVYITAAGELAGTYRKIHLYDAFGYRESDSVIAADIGDPLVFELNGVSLGAATCYDVRFPEISRWLVDRGADVIILPAAWAAGPMKELHWDTLVRARAIENTVYFAACGQTGPHCTGQSLIVDPMGVTLASAGEQSMTLATGTIDAQRITDVRAANPSLTNRRFLVSPNTASTLEA